MKKIIARQADASGVTSVPVVTVEEVFELLSANAVPQALARVRALVNQEPGNPNHLDILTMVAARAGVFEEAIGACQKAIELGGTTPERLYNLALALQDSGNSAAAQQTYLRVIILQPDFALAFNNLGNLFLQQGWVAESIAAFQKAVALAPDWPDCRFGLGMAYRGANRFLEAYATLHDLCAMSAPKFEHLLAAGNTALDIQESQEAERHFRQALLMAPGHVSVMNNLGTALARQERFFEAQEQFELTLQSDPNHAEAHFGLACCHERLMESALADESYQQALRLSPDAQRSPIHSNRLMNLIYRHDICAADVFEAHKAWGDALVSPDISLPRRSIRRPGPIRLGFVSPDLSYHSISMVLPALLDNIDRDRFALAAYAEVKRPDAMTQYYQRSFQHWVNTVGHSAEAIADQIRRDGIDVLIDLAGHTANNRLDIFALKPAPLQITWLGYPATTGLKSIDFRITDSMADSPGQGEGQHTEGLIRLDPCFLCLKLPHDLPPVLTGRELSRPITFGSFNNARKLNPEVIALWSSILGKVPGSRLLLKARELADEWLAEHIYKLFEACGVPRHRVELRSKLADVLQHWNLYNEVDIALDPFPYTGTITTFEALVMGTPVLTLLGDRHSARVSASILHVIGADELIANDAQTYVAKAVALAQDPQRLAGYRLALREQVRNSALCDGKAFAERFGNAIEQALSGVPG